MKLFEGRRGSSDLQGIIEHWKEKDVKGSWDRSRDLGLYYPHSQKAPSCVSSNVKSEPFSK